MAELDFQAGCSNQWQSWGQNEFNWNVSHKLGFNDNWLKRLKQIYLNTQYVQIQEQNTKWTYQHSCQMTEMRFANKMMIGWKDSNGLSSRRNITMGKQLHWIANTQCWATSRYDDEDGGNYEDVKNNDNDDDDCDDDCDDGCDAKCEQRWFGKLQTCELTFVCLFQIILPPTPRKTKTSKNGKYKI